MSPGGIDVIYKVYTNIDCLEVADILNAWKMYLQYSSVFDLMFGPRKYYCWYWHTVYLKTTITLF